jgi:hypothetical protein
MIVHFDTLVVLLTNEIPIWNLLLKSWLILKLTSSFSHLHMLQEFPRRRIMSFGFTTFVGEDNLVKQVNCEFHIPPIANTFQLELKFGYLELTGVPVSKNQI